VWRATSTTVWVAGRQHVLIVAINEATAEVKYFLSVIVHVSRLPSRRWIASPAA
jgi:hypothetical protein